MLNHEHTLASIEVPRRSGARFIAESYLSWTSEMPDDKKRKLVLRVQGEVQERGAKWTEEWIFAWPDADIDVLERGLSLIGKYVDRRVPRGEMRREVFVDVYDWLRVGWVDENKIWKSYARVSKDGRKMEAEFEDVYSLFELRSALWRANAP